MASARRLYRLQIAVGTVALLAVVLTTALTLRSLSFAMLSWSELVETCRHTLLLGFRPLAFLAFALGLLSLLVSWRGARSLVRRVRASRRFEAGLRISHRLPTDPSVRVVHDATPQAFCAGLLRPRIFVSDAAVARLTPDELAAVLAHERHHAAQRDPLRIMAAGVLADALFFLPAVAHIRERYAAVAEVAADAAAARERGPSALASAMLVFGETPHGNVLGVSAERVDHLIDGGPPRWQLRASLLATTAMALGLLYLAALIIRGAGAGAIETSALVMQLCVAYLVGFAAFTARLMGHRSRAAVGWPRSLTPARARARAARRSAG